MITDFKLTKRERDILTLLWANEDGMIASDFPKVMSDLTVNTAQVVLKKLLKRGLVQVKEIVYSGTVLSRKYAPVMSEEDFITAEITQGILNLKRFGISPVMFFKKCMAQMEFTDEEIEELSNFLKKQCG